MKKEQRPEFLLLHTQLGDKYHIDPKYINVIRSFVIGYQKTRMEIAEWCAKRLMQSNRHVGDSRIDHRIKPKEYYQTLLNFVASCSTETWNDITQLTEFDIHHG